MVGVEFTAVILGGGLQSQRMYPLSEKLPKALLPIANRPLIAYQLRLLQRHGFKSRSPCKLRAVRAAPQIAARIDPLTLVVRPPAPPRLAQR